MFDFLMQFDFVAIFKIIGIDIMLGSDNAVVIALACAALPLTLRNRALVIGTMGAIVIRAIFLAIAGLLMGVIAVKIIAGAYLFYIGYSLLLQYLSQNEDNDDVKSPTTVMAAIWTIIVADVMMSIDNVMAVAGAAQTAGSAAIYYAIAGIVISIPIIVVGAKLLTSLIDRFPVIVWAGAGLLGWVGAEMIISDALVISYINHEFDLAYKVAGFTSVILAVVISRSLSKIPQVEGV